MGSKLKIYTSTSEPLYIDQFVVPEYDITVGMTMCPGKSGPRAAGGWWNRNLTLDFGEIRKWFNAQDCTPKLIVNCLEVVHGFDNEIKFDELETLDVSPKDYTSNAINIAKLLRISLKNNEIPRDADFVPKWEKIRAKLMRAVVPGAKILVHCNGGCGRTGLVVGMLLMDLGYSWTEAHSTIKKARLGTFTTSEQLNFLARVEGYRV